MAMPPSDQQSWFNNYTKQFSTAEDAFWGNLKAGQEAQQKYGFGGGASSSSGGVGSSSSSDSSNSSSSASSSLFGNLSNYTDTAKDLARFNLGLNKDQETFDSGLRETEAQNDFGRNYKLADQQIGGQKDITNIQQNATTDRLQRQLSSQQGMQKSGFDQQNLYRAQSAALALRGLR